VPFGAALSVHPISSHATGEVIGQVVEDIGPHPDVAILLVTPGHAGALEDVARTVRHLLAPSVLIGATAPALVGQGANDRGGVGMALWAGVTGPVRPLRLPPEPEANRADLGSATFEAGGAVLLADHATRHPAGLPDDLGGQRIGRTTVGALIAGGPLVLDERTLAGGAVGVAFGPGVRFEALVARGWRAIGPYLQVTESDVERDLILGLDGVPALERLRRVAADEVPAEEVPRINRHLGVGPDQGDVGAVAVREVRGADRSNGAIAAGPIAEGTVVRFWVRGNPGADLRRVLAGRRADTALAFVADPSARGYGAGDHDAEIISDVLGIPRVVGLVAPAQVGPVGNRLRTLRGDAAIALLSDR
jgi:small ligand-binding sensory domain FIST